MDSFFAVTAPGLEEYTARELCSLGLVPPIEPVLETGGVIFKSGKESLYRANLQLRTASRILARLGNFFYATTFPELLQRAACLPWERFLSPGQPVSLRVSCHTSRLYHSAAVGRTVLKALADRLGRPSPLMKLDEENGLPIQLVVVRLSGDQCTISIDSSGALLHRRGYRQAVAKAPLRETLAAGLLLASDWDKNSPLLDPFCGSGTIPIEAAMMALGLPPGRDRRFAFMDWPAYDEKLWSSLLAGSKKPVKTIPPIFGSDRDAGAIRMARENAARAGVAEYIKFTVRAVSSINPPREAGWVVTNPPYGLRISEGKDLRNLYAQFGNVLREKCPGWNVAVLCSDPALLGQMKIKLDTSLGMINGGIKVRVGRGRI